MKQIGDGREHMPVWLIAQDQPVIQVEQHQPFGNTGDGGGQFGFRQIHPALLGLDRGGQVARGAAIAGEDAGVGEKRRAADADGAQAPVTSLKRQVRLRNGRCASRSPSRSVSASGPTSSRNVRPTESSTRGAENRFEIAEEARKAQFGIHFPEPVGRGGGEIAKTLFARADLPFQLFAGVMSRITPMNLRPSSSVISAIANSIGKISPDRRLATASRWRPMIRATPKSSR